LALSIYIVKLVFIHVENGGEKEKEGEEKENEEKLN